MTQPAQTSADARRMHARVAMCIIILGLTGCQSLRTAEAPRPRQHVSPIAEADSAGPVALASHSSADAGPTAEPAIPPVQSAQPAISRSGHVNSQAQASRGDEPGGPVGGDEPYRSLSVQPSRTTGVAACGCHDCVCVCRPDFTFRDDFRDYFPRVRDDAVGTVNWTNGLIFGAAAGAAIAIRQDLDDQVREDTARHPERWGDATHALGKLGEAPIQVPAILAVYGYSLYEDDPELHALSASLISAYTIMGLSTVAIKGITDTERPTDEWNNGRYGFPSFHAASSFTVAAVLEEYYGLKAGVPLYALAGLISWSRIDERDHDVSDVVFGAALGYVVGKSVAGQHLRGDGRVRLLPYTHPTDGASGLMLDVAY